MTFPFWIPSELGKCLKEKGQSTLCGRHSNVELLLPRAEGIMLLWYRWEGMSSKSIFNRSCLKRCFGRELLACLYDWWEWPIIYNLPFYKFQPNMSQFSVSLLEVLQKWVHHWCLGNDASLTDSGAIRQFIPLTYPLGSLVPPHDL